MKRLTDIGLSDGYIVAMLMESIVAEQVAGEFYKYIAKKTKNSRIKNKFLKFGDEEAKNHKKLLNKRLKQIIGRTYNINFNRLNTNIKVSKFSLAGALNMAKESERRAIEFYEEARKIDAKYGKTYNKLAKEEKIHWKIIDEEKQKIKDKEYYKDAKAVKLFALLKQTWKRHKI